MKNSTDAIVISGLQVSYGRKQVLCGVDLNIPRGSIFGFLGRNGAGKTTTIMTLLGLIKPAAGHCLVAGEDPAISPLKVRAAVGYMAEDQQMYGWMRVGKLIEWVGRFYPSWDSVFAASLLKRFDLDPRQKVGKLSKGQNGLLAMLLALGHRPSVVILDDPTLGLDPIARKEFLRYVIDLLQSDGVTVFFSSHMLYEIEPIADHLAILDGGRIIRSGSCDALRESVGRFQVNKTECGEPVKFGELAGLLDLQIQNNVVQITTDKVDQTARSLEAMNIRVPRMQLNLDEIFEAYVIGNRGNCAAAGNMASCGI